MTTTITNYTNSIDVNFPVAGVDNNSLGFRSNFAAIKSALDATGSEISDLQINLVSLDSTNNFGGNQIKNATLIDCSIVLKNYNLSDLSAYTDAGSIENGTLVFVTDTYNCPAYYNEGIWYAFTGTEVSFTGEVTPSSPSPSPGPTPPGPTPPGPTPPGPTPPGPTPPSPADYWAISGGVCEMNGFITGGQTTYSSLSACEAALGSPPSPSSGYWVQVDGACVFTSTIIGGQTTYSSQALCEAALGSPPAPPPSPTPDPTPP